MFKGLESEILPGLYRKAEFLCPCVMRLLGNSNHGGLQSWQRMERVMGPGLPFFMVSTDLVLIFTYLDIESRAVADKILSAISMEKESY